MKFFTFTDQLFKMKLKLSTLKFTTVLFLNCYSLVQSEEEKVSIYPGKLSTESLVLKLPIGYRKKSSHEQQMIKM